jgi:hypothetical protein
VFFNCPVLSVCWNEALKWLGVSAAFTEGGVEHLRLFKGLVKGGKVASDKLGIIWFSIASSIWKARNNIIFKLDGFNWERVMEESKVLSWRIIKSRAKDFNISLNQWLLCPIACMGRARTT